MKLAPQDRIIAALDVESLEEAAGLVKTLMPAGISHFKVGMSLFTRFGPPSVELVHREGGKVFLDLKFHDIPSTVGRTMRSVARLKVWMTNLHIQGGSAMMREAVRALREEAGQARMEPPLLIGVTVLTSMAERDMIDLGLRKTLKDQVIYLARLAKGAGLNGIVASAQEARALRWALGEDFVLVAPGIRPQEAPRDILSVKPGSGTDDQQRTATPAEAVRAGADYLVMGRPIVKAADPKSVVLKIIQELER
ncbi:MAG: orotidine-5'-phosphate decarboxylase [Candidatus Omnitrophica bacterium]|nr:orotidine-5'-phosphate decarboxylase [Candidatus Omnitrophota bacterium]